MSHLPVKRPQSLSERFYHPNDTFPVKAPVNALQRMSDAFTGVFEIGQLLAALKKNFSLTIAVHENQKQNRAYAHKTRSEPL